MRILLDGADVNSAASWVVKFTNWRVSNLAGIMLNADETFTARATDHERFGTYTIPAAIVDDGEVIVPGRGLAAVGAQLKRGDEVTLSAERSDVVITRGRTTWSLPRLTADYQPSWPSVGAEFGCVDGLALKAALKQVLPAVAEERKESEFEIGAPNGVEFTLGKRITLAATDTRRIAVAELDWEPVATGTVVVSEAMCKSIATILTGSVRIHSDRSTVTFTTGPRQVIGPLLGTKFLGWRNAMPSVKREASTLGGRPGISASTVVTVDTQELLRCVKAVSVFSVTAGKEAGDYLEVRLDSDRITVTSQNREHGRGKDGDATDVIKPVEFTGPSISIGVQPHYLSEALATIGTPRVVLTFMDRSFAPVLMRGAGEDGVSDDFQYVLMPLKLARRAAA